MVERLCFLLFVSGLSACSHRGTPGTQTERSSDIRPATVLFQGMCDASGAVPLGGTLFAVADDEDNVLRTYDAARGGAPITSVDISGPLGLGARSAPEIDIEAATRLGDLALWIGSHGRSSSGKLKRERLRMFATTLHDARLELVGTGFDGLLDALFADPRYVAFDLKRAAQRASKEPGGLNIEGMVARPGGGVWIGFRSPTPQAHALLAALENAEEVVHGAPARLGAPRLLDLAGRGIRDLSWWHGSYLIIAGAAAEGGVSVLYRWHESSAPAQVIGVDLSWLNPEALFASEQQDRIMLLSDDGARKVDGVECKHLDDARKKQFRGIWLSLPDLR